MAISIDQIQLSQGMKLNNPDICESILNLYPADEWVSEAWPEAGRNLVTRSLRGLRAVNQSDENQTRMARWIASGDVHNNSSSSWSHCRSVKLLCKVKNRNLKYSKNAITSQTLFFTQFRHVIGRYVYVRLSIKRHFYSIEVLWSISNALLVQCTTNQRCARRRPVVFFNFNQNQAISSIQSQKCYQ